MDSRDELTPKASTGKAGGEGEAESCGDNHQLRALGTEELGGKQAAKGDGVRRFSWE